MKILYVTTISNTVNAFLIPHIEMLIDEGHQVDIAFNLVQEVKKDLLDLNINIYQIPFNRSPFSIDNLKAFKELKKLVLNEKYDIVHTHTPIASAIVRFVCKDIKETRVFYTAHGFHFHKGAPIYNWLIYYTLEKYLSKYTDTLITINQEDYERSKAKFHTKQIEYIPGVGIDLGKLENIKIDKVKKRKELNIPADAFVILSVGELNKNKNHEVIIKALSKIKDPNIHYLICGEGPLEKYLKDMSFKFGIEKSVHFAGFRNDILEIYKVADVFAFPSLREGLGLSAIEAMTSGLPIITSDIHGIVDYSINNVTGYLCERNDYRCFSESISKFIQDNRKLEEFSLNNKKSVLKYDLKEVLLKIKDLYY